MDDSGGPHHRPPSLSPPPPDAGKRRRVPNVRLAGSIPLPSHLPHPRKVPVIPAARSRKPQHHNGGSTCPASEPPPQALPKPCSPASSADDLILAAALPRKPPRVPEAEAEAESQGEEEVVDVAGWLWGMGMGRYVPAFEAHEVDAEVLPCLTMDDLRDMGIGAVGARRKLFCAIQRLPQPRR